ncbi:MAG: response regulator [Chloroflexi bacterium]|nr:response regulator [Chloroflexota bacterium]
MAAPVILIVDDNPITRKLVRVTLQAEGYAVVEASDGRTAVAVMAERRPDLVLQDLVLPDVDGFELLRRLRALPGGDVPILAFSGFLSRVEQARSLQVGFTDYLFKPVEPSRLAELVRAYVRPTATSREWPGVGRRVLAVEDDPIPLKLLRIHLEQMGFQVDTAADGASALEQARRSPPDAIVSDVLMPRLDGFRLCLAVRQDPVLARVPVVLVSAIYFEEGDRRLARDAGASALVARTPDLQKVGEALLASLSGEPPATARPAELRVEEYADRAIRQLERQASLSAGLARRVAWHEAQLAILAGLADATRGSPTIDGVLDELVSRCVGAAGISLGVAFLREPDGRLVRRAQVGYPDSLLGQREESLADLLQQAIEGGEAIVIPSPAVPVDRAAALLRELGGRSLVISPLRSGAERLGALALVFASRDEAEEWRSFARAAGSQIGQALALARTLFELRDSESRLARIIETVPEGVAIVDREGQITQVNAALERLLGLPHDAIVSRRYDDPSWKVSTPEGQPVPMDRGLFARIVQTGQPLHGVERTIERADGGKITVSVNIAPLHDSAGATTGAVVTVDDVTERRRAEQQLRLRLGAMEAAANAIVILDRDCVVQWVNPSFTRLTGYSAEEVVGQPIWTGRPTGDDLSFHEQIVGTLVSGQIWEGESADRRKDGTPYTQKTTITPVRANGREVTHFIGITEDVTRQRSLEEQVRQSQKMDAIGRLAGGVAHDFNNMLTLVNGYSELLLAELGPSHPLRMWVEEIARAGERASTLTHQLLAFSRQEVVSPQDLDLDVVIAEVEKMLRRLIGEDVELVTRLRSSPALVRADRGHLEQVVMNLAVNARDAMPRGGTLAIETAHVEIDEAQAQRRVDARPGPHVVLTVSDTGHGMTPEVLAHLFEPFFTTKEKGKGTGLGLSTVYGIVKQSGGHLEVESKPEQGTTFRICLPRLERPVASAVGEQAPRPKRVGGSETILVVEDEDLVRSLVRQTLEAEGYTVLEAPDGEEALRQSEQYPGRIDLLIADVVMPRMSGREVVERLGPQRPETRVLSMSGYTDDTVVRHGALAADIPFLQKPFSPAALLKKVREVLDSPRAQIDAQGRIW